MININTIKALLSFYLEVRFNRWSLPTDGNLVLPTDENKLHKIRLVSKLYYNLHRHSEDKDFLLKFCDELKTLEEKELASHSIGSKIFDYPLLALTIRALRSHILDASSPHKKLEGEAGELQNYVNGEFLTVLKYEDKHYTGGKYQQIKKIADFIAAYKENASSYSLLDRVYALQYKARHQDRKESALAVVALGVLAPSKVDTTNKERNINISSLFNEKASRKAERAARPVLKAAEPKNTSTSLQALDEILANLDRDLARDKQFPALGMKK